VGDLLGMALNSTLGIPTTTVVEHGTNYITFHVDIFFNLKTASLLSSSRN
jgi:hypothetical protein